MIKLLFQKIAVVLTIAAASIFNAGGYDLPKLEAPAPIVQPLGSTNAIPDTVALFSTSLQSPITASQTTMTLVSAAYNGGASTLASSTYGFIIDEGTSVEELVTGDCTATVCTNLTRGIDRLTGSSTVTSLKFAHRRGASVKITDAPSLLIINRIIQGIGSFPNIISYTTAPTFTTGLQLIDKTYVDGVAFSGAGAVAATEGAVGYSRLATQVQQASSTPTLGGSPLVLQSKYATSTYNSATAALNLVVTQNSGKIDDNFISTSTLFTNISLATTSQIGAFPAYQIGKNSQVITTTGTSSFTVPSGITRVFVQLVGAGASGATAPACANPGSAGGGGGGAGGYAEKNVNISGTTSIQVHISTASTDSTYFGTNGFYFGATSGTSASNQTAGTGGTGVSGDLNIVGGSGSVGGPTVTTVGNAWGGNGGNSFYGGGGAGALTNGSASAPTTYGAGGGGGSCLNASSGSGAAGAQGLIKITW